MKQTETGKLSGRRSKYRGKDHTKGYAVRLTPFATVHFTAAMEARGLSSFYDLVEELIREDVAKLGIVEDEAARRRREGEPAPKRTRRQKAAARLEEA